MASGALDAPLAGEDNRGLLHTSQTKMPQAKEHDAEARVGKTLAARSKIFRTEGRSM
jgi:hypothetical protein